MLRIKWKGQNQEDRPVLHVHVKEPVIGVAVRVKDDVEVDIVDADIGDEPALGQVEAEVSASAIERVRRVDQLELEVNAKLGHVQLLVPVGGGAEHDGLGEDGEEVGDAPVPLHPATHSPRLNKRNLMLQFPSCLSFSD